MRSNEVILPNALEEERRRESRRGLTIALSFVGLSCVAIVCIVGAFFWRFVPPNCMPWGNPSQSSGQLAMVSDRDGNAEIYLINADGTGATRLTNDPAGDYHPAWSPDGKRLAFHSDRGGNNDIYIMNADGSGVKRLTTHSADDYDPSWSPDGQQIAFHSHREVNGRIFIMNADGSRQRRVTEPPNDDWSPVWSPDGKYIVFNSSRYNLRRIWILNLDNLSIRNISGAGEEDWWPVWSPDGERIAFHSNLDSRTQGDFNIYTINPNGSGRVRLTDSPSRESDASWSPDSKQIAYTSTICGTQDVWIMDADGSHQANITLYEPGRNWLPAWRP